MRKEQRWFIKRVSIGLFGTLCAAQLLAFALDAWVQSRIESSERIALEAMQTAAVQLTGSTDTSSFSTIAENLRATKDLMYENRLNTQRVQTSLRIVETATLFGASESTYRSETSSALVTATDTFTWLSSATPAIARIAGYDARQDVVSAYDARDLYRRLYAAHIGMSALVPLLNKPPVTVGVTNVADISNSIHEALEYATESIRALDAGGSVDASLTRYVSSATKAAALSAALQERLTSEPLKASLLKLLQ